MALWKDSSTSVKEPVKDPPKDLANEAAGAINLAPPSAFSNPTVPEVPSVPVPTIPEPRMVPMTASTMPAREAEMRRSESIITNELTIEGKIEGTGNVRIAGKFKGEVNVQGNLVIEQGAMVTANVRAQTITIAGQLEGNIEGATRVELLETGVLTGDVMADSLTVAAGSRMRGKADFGWTDKASRTT
ncbi:MAG: polymer-forming cytoskeletal protein [Gemmatimonas sp.]